MEHVKFKHSYPIKRIRFTVYKEVDWMVCLHLHKSACPLCVWFVHPCKDRTHLPVTGPGDWAAVRQRATLVCWRLRGGPARSFRTKADSPPLPVCCHIWKMKAGLRLSRTAALECCNKVLLFQSSYFLRKTERKFCAVLIAVSYEFVIKTSWST